MPPKFAKKDRVKVLATRFDKEEVEEGAQKFSEKWAADGQKVPSPPNPPPPLLTFLHPYPNPNPNYISHP